MFAPIAEVPETDNNPNVAEALDSNSPVVVILPVMVRSISSPMAATEVPKVTDEAVKVTAWLSVPPILDPARYD